MRHILSYPAFYFSEMRAQSFVEPMLGRRETANNIQQGVALFWFVTQIVIHDANVADEKGLLVCLNELS